MTSKERALTAFARQEPDRVPINYSANPGIDRRVKEHFGLSATDDEGLRQALGVDFRHVSAPYVGPKLHADVPERQIDIWGMHYRWIEHSSGGYWDLCDFPLKSATLEEIEAWPLPSPDDFDYSVVASQCKAYEPYCVIAGNSGVSTVINFTGRLRSMDQVFMDLITDDEAGMCLVDRLLNVRFEVLQRTIEAAEGRYDLLWMGEDLGTQRGPIISRPLFEKQVLPRHKRFIELGHAHNLPTVLHTCGSSSWAYDDYIALGVSVVDTLQPEVKDMAPRYLKERFGDKLAFHGCISTAGPVAFGTVDEVVEDVRETLAIMMPGGGYAMSPAHALQDNSPTENVLALYETTHTYGRY